MGGWPQGGRAGLAGGGGDLGGLAGVSGGARGGALGPLAANSDSAGGTAEQTGPRARAADSWVRLDSLERGGELLALTGPTAHWVDSTGGAGIMLAGWLGCLAQQACEPIAYKVECSRTHSSALRRAKLETWACLAAWGCQGGG